jgi:hypothetical protein
MAITGCTDYGAVPVIIPPVTGLSVSDQTMIEGETVMFTISVDEIDTVDISVTWSLVDSSAQSGDDFVVDSGTITIPAGDLSVLVQVNSVDDSIIESGEYFKVMLSNSQNVEIGDSVGIGTIWDDDGVRFLGDIQPILLNNCAFIDCHGDGSMEGGLAMGEATYEEVRHASGDIGAVLIPGNGGNSPLYLVTTPSAMTDIDRMPSGGPYLTTGQQKKIKDWIDQGAQDN